MNPADALLAEALAMRELGAGVVEATDLGTHAIEYAVNHWRVFPLRGKVPAIAGSRGVLDATSDVEQVARWWGGRYRGCNIGARVPDPLIVIDVDPRHGGDRSLAELEQKHSTLPDTLTTVSGRGDGGRHLYFRRPSGNLSAKRLGAGIDLKTSTGYVVLAPSIHPDSGKPYVRRDAVPALPPAWLVELLLPEITLPREPRRHIYPLHSATSIADQFSQAMSWADVLEPHGWRCLDADPDADGARWLHPTHTSACSATVRNGCLFVYSSNTPFDVTEPSIPRGYTRFRAYAVLDHRGDMKAAAKALRDRQAATC